MQEHSDIVLISRPKRWDTPFSSEMSDQDVQQLLDDPLLADIPVNKFPSHTPLAGILKNDARLRKFAAGEIIVGAGDYGNSAFGIVRGQLREFSAKQLSDENLGRLVTHKRNIFETIAQIWQLRRIPEVRNFDKNTREIAQVEAKRGFVKDARKLSDQYHAGIYEEGAWFGEFAALGRMPHPATVVAETECVLLEIRWQGLREIRSYCEKWREVRDAQYRSKALKALLHRHSLFRKLDENALDNVVGQTLFETYGSYDWHGSYKERETTGKADEPIIAEQGGYADGLIIIRAGFARLTNQIGHGERTLTYLGPGQHFGLEELYEAWKTGAEPTLKNSLKGLGYVDVLRVPTKILETWVFPTIKGVVSSTASLAGKGKLTGNTAMEWLVDERLINGNKAMLIDLDRCVRCDDCVRACSTTHGGNPRFFRGGKTFDHWMVANACMHCTDPVCLIGCPTGAIHRSESGGTVLINDRTCIGCSTCANSCPYDNIVMVAINDNRGRPILDPNDQKPIWKATKCDLCTESMGGPACVRACPYDALQRVDFRDLSLG
jgi:Fe-S-cluster-containing dehydrogenase component/CRP-like cAMP-binding protein